jgi:hypothetical protein
MLKSGPGLLLATEARRASLQIRAILNIDRSPPIPLLPRRPLKHRPASARTPDGGGQFFDAVRSPLS